VRLRAPSEVRHRRAARCSKQGEHRIGSGVGRARIEADAAAAAARV
jgi:hypothetical protein